MSSVLVEEGAKRLGEKLVGDVRVEGLSEVWIIAMIIIRVRCAD